MARRFTFGIELEFALGCIVNKQKPLPDPTTTKVVRFEPLDEDRIPPKNSDYDDIILDKEKVAVHYAAQRHIAKSMAELSIPVQRDPHLWVEGFEMWQVAEDASVNGPKDSLYDWLDMEIISPKLPLTSKSLDQVVRVCDLLTRTYITYNDQTSGMHVHLGQDDYGFSFPDLTKIVEFLWAFEPQLSSLHPSYRQERKDTKFCLSMRWHSKIAEDYLLSKGERLSAGQGIVCLSQCKSVKELLEQISVHPEAHSGRYNFGGLLRKAQDFDDYKPTIEFRQHEGTLDGRRVVVWVTTLAKIVEFLQEVHPQSFIDLMAVATHETWQQMGDGKDSEREVERGPILAHQGFTVIDLFNWMGLTGQANYFSTRWHKHAKKTPEDTAGCLWSATYRKAGVVGLPDLPTLLTTWEYQKQFDPKSEEYKRKHQLRGLWEHMKRFIDNDSTGDYGMRFDPDSSFWPKHETDVLVNPSEASPVIFLSEAPSEFVENDSLGSSSQESSSQNGEREKGDSEKSV